jgi:hypothetical protein
MITPGAREYATEVALLASRYLFVEHMGKKQWAYCTHCHGGHEPEQVLTHGQIAACPHCLSACKVKAAGRGHLHLVDQTYFVYYDKAPNNPDGIVAHGIHAIRDYSGDYRNVETQFYVLAYYVFEPGHAAMMAEKSYWSEENGNWIRTYAWAVCATVYPLPKFYQSGFPTSYSVGSIRAAVADTPFRWCCWEQYKLLDMTEFFALAARYKCVEYLAKLGYRHLIVNKIERQVAFPQNINWRGKNILAVLKITKPELNEIRSQQATVTYEFLEVMRRIREKGWKLSAQEAVSLTKDFYDPWKFETLSEFLNKSPVKKFPIRKILAYLDKQFRRDREHYSDKHGVVITWRDYLEDAKRNRMDLKSDHVLFPKSVYSIHQHMIEQAKIKVDAKLNAQIAGRLEDLTKRYYLEFAGLIIRPAKDTLELIREGEALHHCVGSYGRSYAEGKTVILLVRKASEPDKPYYTIEVRPGDKAAFQVQGKYHKEPGPDVAELMTAFTKEKLVSKKEARVRIAV